MTEKACSVLRGVARDLMLDLDRNSLGIYGNTYYRDTFRLYPDLPAVRLLTDRPSQRNFIRSEDDSLLFRAAAPALMDALDDRVLMLGRANSQKGLEFSWSRLDEATLRYLFATVASLAQHSGRPALPKEQAAAYHPPRVKRRSVYEGRRTKGVLSFQFFPGDVSQTDWLIYVWEIHDPAGKPRYRYVGKSEPGAARPLNRYGLNVTNLLEGRPYSPGAPNGFRVVHKRLADAVDWQWPVKLSLITNVPRSNKIFKVEEDYQKKLEYDDWPPHGRP